MRRKHEVDQLPTCHDSKKLIGIQSFNFRAFIIFLKTYPPFV